MKVFNSDLLYQSIYNRTSYLAIKTSNFLLEVLRKKSSILSVFFLIFTNFILLNIFTILGIILGAILGSIVRYQIDSSLVNVFLLLWEVLFLLAV